MVNFDSNFIVSTSIFEDGIGPNGIPNVSQCVSVRTKFGVVVVTVSSEGLSVEIDDESLLEI